MPVEVGQGLRERLEAAQKEVREAEDVRRIKLAHRKELIYEALDQHGMSQQELAGILGLAKGRISAILATPDRDDDG